MVFFKKMFLAIIIGLFMMQLLGCGATLDGMGKDLTRQGEGIRKIFIRD